MAVETGVRKELSVVTKENKLILADEYTIAFLEDNTFYSQNQHMHTPYIYIYIYIYKSAISMPASYVDIYIAITRECNTLSYSKNFNLDYSYGS